MSGTKHAFGNTTACARALLRGRVEMKGLGVVAASAAAVMLGGTVGASAADLDTKANLDTKAPVLKAQTADPFVCTTIMDFFTTACQVAAYGVRFYGTVNIGEVYQTNGSPITPRTA
jgi:hypothetical protein